MSIRSDKSEGHLKKLVSSARALVTYQVGIPHGCKRLNGILSWLKQDGVELDYPVFREYLKEVEALPAGSERLIWDREKLMELDQRLEAINRKYRDRIFAGAFEIIDQFGPSADL